MRVGALSVVMCVGLLMTGMGVYAEGRFFAHHQYVFVLWYPALCVVFYGVAVALHPPSRAWLRNEWHKWRVYAPLGVMWSINYAFILTANTYTSNLFQVVFTQFQLVYAFYMNKYLTGAAFGPQQPVLVIALILVNLLLIGNTIEFSDSFAWNFYWQLVYMLNGAGAAVGSILTEAYFKSLVPEPSLSAFEFEVTKTLVLNFVVNVYSLVGNLAFVYVIYPIDRTISPADLWDTDLLWSADSWSYYLMFAGTLVFTVASTLLFYYTNVTYTAVVSSVANLLQVVTVSLPVVGARLQQVSTVTQYMIYGIGATLSIMYAHYQPERRQKRDVSDGTVSRVQESYLVAYYRGTGGALVNRMLFAFVALVVGITLPLAFWVRR
jgi:hypothetical protein